MNSYNCAYCSRNFNSDAFGFVCYTCKARKEKNETDTEDRTEIAQRSINNLLALAKLEPTEAYQTYEEDWTEEDELNAKILADIAKKIKRPNVLMPLTKMTKLIRSGTGMIMENGEFKEFRDFIPNELLMKELELDFDVQCK